MKNKILCLFLIMFCAFNYFSCNQNFKNPVEDVEETDELIPADDYFVDISKISFWSTSDSDSTPCGTYDDNSGKITLSVMWKAGQIWLGNFDASNYRYIKIQYHGASSTFRIQCTYEDGSTDLQLCENLRQVQYLKLNKDKSGSIKSIALWNINGENVEFNLDSIRFTQNYTLPPAVIDEGNVFF